MRRYLPGHEVVTTREKGWETLVNGLLLRTAAMAGFDVLFAVDKKMEHNQNLTALPLPVVILDAKSNALASLIPFSPILLSLLANPLDPLLYVIEPSGMIHRLARRR